MIKIAYMTDNSGLLPLGKFSTIGRNKIKPFPRRDK